MSFNAFDPINHRNAHIIYTAPGNVLDADENGNLFKFSLCSRIFWRIADFVTCGLASSARRERVFKAMQTTLTKIHGRLETAKGNIRDACSIYYSSPSNEHLKDACEQLVTYSTNARRAKTEALANLKDRISLISRSNLSTPQKEQLLEEAEKISAIIATIKEDRNLVDDCPVSVISGVPIFEGIYISRSCTKWKNWASSQGPSSADQ